jgi:hypothetical protein
MTEPDVADAGQEPEEESVESSLRSVRLRRFELGEAADQIEESLAHPSSDPRWSVRVLEALTALRIAFDEHVREVERPDGLLNRLVEEDPRLANGVTRMHDEHGEIDLRLNEVRDLICLCEPDCGHTQIEDVRVAAVDTLSLISRHRQAGADLVYEAYNVDIGGG